MIRGMAIGCGMLVVFIVGFWLGGAVWRGLYGEELDLGRKCIEGMVEVNLIGDSIVSTIMEVSHEKKRPLFLGGGPLRAGNKPGVQSVPRGMQGKGGG